MGSRRSPAESERTTSASATCSPSTARRRGPSSTPCLQKYQDDGVVAGLDDRRILQIPPIDRMGTTVELIRQFGGKDGFEDAVHELQRALYEVA